jgi:hypothetical protein
MDQDSHQQQISQHGDQTIGKMKPNELREQCGTVAAVAPSVVQVPYKIVYERKLNGRSRGIEIVARRNPIEESERGKLHHHPHGPYQIEFAPADEGVHGSGSCR